MSAVIATDIVKTFGDVVALDGVSLQFEEGIVYGLLGPNGAGKTTLIRVLATLLKPDSGSASVVGTDVLADPVGARHQIGLAGQSAAVDGFLTGRENVEMVLSADRRTSPASDRTESSTLLSPRCLLSLKS